MQASILPPEQLTLNLEHPAAFCNGLAPPTPTPHAKQLIASPEMLNHPSRASGAVRPGWRECAARPHSWIFVFGWYGVYESCKDQDFL